MKDKAKPTNGGGGITRMKFHNELSRTYKEKQNVLREEYRKVAKSRVRRLDYECTKLVNRIIKDISKELKLVVEQGGFSVLYKKENDRIEETREHMRMRVKAIRKAAKYFEDQGFVAEVNEDWQYGCIWILILTVSLNIK